MVNSYLMNREMLCPASKIIGVLSGKGGVGKSTITAELALTFAQDGHKVGVLDADIYGPSIRALLPDEQPPKVIGEKVIPAQSQGVSVISAAHFPKGKTPSGVRAPVANQIITQFIDEVEWGLLDVLLIDFPPGTGDIQITLMQNLKFNGVLVVTTPCELSLLDVRKSMGLCLQMGAPLLGIVENMSYYCCPETGTHHYLFGKGGGKLLAKEFGVPMMTQIPIDKGLNLAEAEKTSSVLFRELGRELIDLLVEEKRYKINGMDRYSFSIEWLDGKKSVYRFSDVQKVCPCAACALKKETSLPNVEGLEVVCIGNYGVRIVFSKGCSKGIYPFSYLRRLDR